jgi:hypothetical protein
MPTREPLGGSCPNRPRGTHSWGPADRTLTGIDTMRIVDIRECAVTLNSDMRNSSFDFSEMTTSVVAVVTDVVRDGRPIAGFAFNSTGRYACGASCARAKSAHSGRRSASSWTKRNNLDPEKFSP